MDGAYQAYFQFLGELGKALEQLTAINREKTEAVRRDDLLRVNDCMKREQVLGLTLRSMEVRREKMLAGLGLAGSSLSALAERCPPELRPEARAASDRLRRQYAIYQSAADVARMTLECNIHELEKIMEKQGVDPAAAGPLERGLADIRA